MNRIDNIIHQPVRLRIVSALSVLGEEEGMDFSFLRKSLNLSDGNLGAHLDKLAEAEYISVEKAFVNRRPKTTIALTTKGRRAFEDYVRAMKSIIG